MTEAMDHRALERAERARESRMKLGLTWLGVGAMSAGVGVISPVDWNGWIIGASGATAVIAATFAWANRPGDPARRLERSTGARERAQKARAEMLGVIPGTMIVFGVLSIKAMTAIQAGEAEFGDWAMMAVALLYAWMGPLFVMGWDGASLRRRALLEDELTRHHRALAVIPAFVVLLVLMTGLCILGLWRADWAITAMPAALCVSGALAAFRFGRLDRQAGEGE